MTDKEVKTELEQLLTTHIGLSIVGLSCVVLFLMHQL